MVWVLCRIVLILNNISARLRGMALFVLQFQSCSFWIQSGYTGPPCGRRVGSRLAAVCGDIDMRAVPSGPAALWACAPFSSAAVPRAAALLACSRADATENDRPHLVRARERGVRACTDTEHTGTRHHVVAHGATQERGGSRTLAKACRSVCPLSQYFSATR